MAAAVETMMYAGDVPWHGEGVYVGDQNVHSKQALEASGLEWEVEKRAMYAHTEPGRRQLKSLTNGQLFAQWITQCLG